MFGLMGDVLMRSAVLRSFRQLEPCATIHCYADPVGSEVLSLSSDPRRTVIVLRHRRNKTLFSVVEKILFLWRVRREKYDLLFDLYNGPLSQRILRWSCCSNCFWIKDAKIHSSSGVVADFPPLNLENPNHLNNLYFRLLSAWRGFSVPTDPMPWIDQSGGDTHWPDIGHGDYFISVSSGDPRKNLAIDFASTFVKFVYENFGWVPAIALNPGSEVLQEELCKLLSESQIPYRRLPECSLGSILQAMRASRFSVLPDTGLFHLALGSGKPVFGIFTYTNPCLVDPVLPWVQFFFKEVDPPKLDQHGVLLGSRDHNFDGVVAAAVPFLWSLKRGQDCQEGTDI